MAGRKFDRNRRFFRITRLVPKRPVLVCYATSGLTPLVANYLPTRYEMDLKPYFIHLRENGYF